MAVKKMKMKMRAKRRIKKRRRVKKQRGLQTIKKSIQTLN